MVLISEIPALIDKTFPLPGRFRSALPSDIAGLSRLLTSGRGERSLSYLGRPDALSAYLRYFLPWNLYRLCRLLPDLGISLAAHDHIADLGCGPLTFAAALWLCRPDLRELPLEFHCIDRSGPALDAGKKFFAALAGASPRWKIHAIKGDIAAVKTPPSALTCAVNVFNEMYGDISRNAPVDARRNAEKTARLLESHAAENSAILIVEPGFPRCGEFISLLRDIFMERGRKPFAPCPHDCPCPCPGEQNRHKKSRWCHFAFDTDDAPASLHRLSAAAKLPKERAVLSYLLVGPERNSQDKDKCKGLMRVISDAFPLPHGRWGRYGCTSQGLALLAGEKSAIEKTASGALANVVFTDETDAKSGALVAICR